MNLIERQLTYIRAIRHFGERHQMLKLVEELNELGAAIMKYVLETHGRLNVLEEVADVEILLKQMRLILKADSTIDGFIDSKLERLARQLDAWERSSNTLERSKDPE